MTELTFYDNNGTKIKIKKHLVKCPPIMSGYFEIPLKFLFFRGNLYVRLIWLLNERHLVSIFFYNVSSFIMVTILKGNMYNTKSVKQYNIKYSYLTYNNRKLIWIRPVLYKSIQAFINSNSVTCKHEYRNFNILNFFR